MTENDNSKQESSMIINPDDTYERWLSRYYRNRLFCVKAYVSNKIKGFLSAGLMPTKKELLYGLGRFLYMEMTSDNIAIEWLAITLIDQASSDEPETAGEFIKLIVEEHRKQAQTDAKYSMISQSLLGRYLALKDSSDPEAGELLKKAADKGEAESEFLLSICYISGLCGLKEDKSKAVCYAKRAFEHGNLKAAFNLGCFYANGDGCEKNIAEAERYFKIASEDGHPNAQEELDKLCSAEEPQSKPDASLELVKEEIINEVIKALKQDSAENTKRIISSNDSNGDRIVANTNEQSELIRKIVTDESKKIKELVEAIPIKTRKLIFDDINTAINDNRDSLKKIEEMHKQMQSDISEIKQNTEETNSSIEDLTSEMQVFFDEMDKKCRDRVLCRDDCGKLCNACRNELSSLFGNYWENGQLLASTKDSLIAARVLLACAEGEGLSDFRGIVISATSALERELKARFYTGVRKYFSEKNVWNGTTEEDLPKNLRLKINKNEDAFTLGDVSYILTCESYRTSELLNNYNNQQKECLRDYLREKILSDAIVKNQDKYKGYPYKNNRPEDILIYNGGRDNSFIEKLSNISNTYRNPAAHTQATTKDTAQSCCKAVIGQGEIDRIEGLLLELLRITEKFIHTN